MGSGFSHFKLLYKTRQKKPTRAVQAWLFIVKLSYSFELKKVKLYRECVLCTLLCKMHFFL